MLLLMIFTLLYWSLAVTAYSNKLFTLTIQNNTRTDICIDSEQRLKLAVPYQNLYERSHKMSSPRNKNLIKKNKHIEKDPFEIFNGILYKFIIGENYIATQKLKDTNHTKFKTYNLLHSPTGRALRKAELFNRKIGVHFPIVELMHRGYCKLEVTEDYMQTAVDAFAIFVNGDLADIQRLPLDYVLNSARTISMMKISHEKLAATWSVVKGARDPMEVSYETLEKYRPLFKYLGGKDMAMLNLSDPRILKYIGTHPNLDRHQVGLVASAYIKRNKRWSEPKFLNLMNNLICGVPINYMREILENTYLQLSHQVFYHTRACDPLQRRFFLGMMTKTQALGKSYSWNSQDVSRLGLLLAEVQGEALGSIKPEALAGLSTQVAQVMLPENLQHLTQVQLQYIRNKPFNILSKKLKLYKDRWSFGVRHMPVICIIFLNILVVIVIFTHAF